MMVSHELRTPLNAIEGWASLIAQGEVDGEEAQQGLQTILRNAKAQNRIIDDLMDTSTIILNRISFDQKPVDVIPIIEDAIETLRLNAQKKNLKIEFENNFVSAGSREAWILGDPERLLQTFNNLLNNAIKFTPENGQIWVKAKLAGPSVSISIRDTGEGIPKDFLPYVFERFRQADDSLTRKHGGLGLGLAIVRHIVTAFAGTIEAQSEGPNRGATFTVQFPLYDRTSVTESSSTSLRNENASRYSASSIPYAAASTSH